jgi:spermidine synthase
MRFSNRTILAIVMSCLFVSGIAGLVYEIVWSRYLALFLGHTSYAVIAVLVAFMGGLALGSYWLGRVSDQVRNPLAFYAWLEIGIGVYALLFPHYFELSQSLYLGIASHLSSGSALSLALKFLFSLATILVPTVLMGGTLPVLIRLITHSLSELREKIAALYFINSAGAVIGCWVADFWWIPDFGLQFAVYAAGGLNLLVGVVAIYVNNSLKERQSSAEPASEVSTEQSKRDTVLADEQAPEMSSRDLKMAIVAIGISGFVAMLYQVTWTRFLALAIGSNTHAFSIMLITFISGITLGAWIIYRRKVIRSPFDTFAWAEIALAVSLFISLFYYKYLPFVLAKMASYLSRSESVYPVYEIMQAVVCFVVMFVPAVFLGMTLPLITRVATSELKRLGRSVGIVFSVNTTGTVFGAIMTGLWLMPALGLGRTILLGVTLSGLVGLAVLARQRLKRIEGSWVVMFIVVGVLFWLLGGALNKSWQRVFTAELWRTVYAPSDWNSVQARLRPREIMYYRDGASATVCLLSEHDAIEKKTDISLLVNGKTDASLGADMITQLMLGHLPLLMRPESEEVLVIGLGSGMTSGAVSVHPSVKHIDTVEISAEVKQAAQSFAEHNHNVLEDENFELVIEDAKTHLRSTQRSYDIIISEPSNPWMAGVAGVFSLEFYQSCLARMKSGGIMVQWVHVYESNDEALEMILRTFSKVFPYTSIWSSSFGDLLLVGSVLPKDIDLDVLAQRFHEPAVLADLQRINMGNLVVFLSREVISEEHGALIVPAEGPVHSDYYPRLDYLAQRAFFVGERATRWRQFDENFAPRSNKLLAQYLQHHPLTEADYLAFYELFIERGLPQVGLMRAILDRWLIDQPDNELALELSANLSYRGISAQLEVDRFTPARELVFAKSESDPELMRLYAKYLMTSYRGNRSLFHIPETDELADVVKHLISVDPPNQRLYKLYLSEIAWDKHDDERCAELALEAYDPASSLGGTNSFELDPKTPAQVMVCLIEAKLRAGKFDEAATICASAEISGYTGPQAKHGFPKLDMMLRKAKRAIDRQSAIQQ